MDPPASRVSPLEWLPSPACETAVPLRVEVSLDSCVKPNQAVCNDEKFKAEFVFAELAILVSAAAFAPNAQQEPQGD